MDQLWWTHINNARLLINRITDSLIDNKSLILHLSDQVPWYDTMRRLVENEMINKSYMRRLKYKRENEIGDDPGKYLFDHYCGEGVKLQYRPAMGYAQFLAKETTNTLKQTYLWLRFDSSERAYRWINFIEEYQKHLGDAAGGVFLIEVRGALPTTNGRIEILSYDNMIGPYDRIVFNMLAAADVRLPNGLMKQYLAELVSSVVGNDIELSAECVKRGEHFLFDPRGVIQSIVEEQRRSDGSMYEFDRGDDHIEQCEWTEQIKLTFPLMENFRRKLIERHYAEINRCLPSPSGFGEKINEPKEADIGFLYHNAYRWSLTTEEWDRLKMCRDARNPLAHIKTLDLDKLQEIFNAL